MITDGHKCYLIPHLVLLLWIVHRTIHELKCILYGGALALFGDKIDLAVPSLAEEFLNAVVQSWVVVLEEILMLNQTVV